MTCLLIFQGAYAINMQFSASDGGGNSVSISESYNVDNGVEVWGQSSAAFGEGLKIDDRRRFTGPGNIYAVQEYAGSGGYVGMSYIYAEDAAHTLARGSAHLTPGALGVVQDASIRDAGACAVVSTANQGGRGTMQHASVWDGSLDSRQTIGVDGGIATSQDTQMVGDLPTAFGTAGYMDVNLGPSNLKIEGEGAAVAVSSLDLAGPAEVDCNLATGTGNSAWAYGKIRSAESDLGAVGAAAGAGKIDLEADWTGDLPELYIDGYGEAAAAGVGAIGVNNEIRGTLAASTTDAGTSASGREIEASNREGAVVAAAAAGGLGIGVDLQNGFIGGGAEAAGVGVLAEGRRNWIESENLAAGTGFYGTGAYGSGIEAYNKRGTVAAAAAAGGLGGIVDLQNGFVDGGAETADVGVLAEGRSNWIESENLAAGTGFYGTGAYGSGIKAYNRVGTVVAAAAAGGLGAGIDLQNGFVDGGAEAAGVGVLAEGRSNWIESEALAAGIGFYGTGAYGSGIEAYNRVGTVVAAAAAGGLGAGIDLQDGIIAGDAEAAGIGVGAEGYRNRIRSGTLAAGTGGFGTGAIGEEIEASNKEGVVAAAAAAGGLGGIVDLQSGFIAGGAEAAGIGVGAEGYRNRIRSGTLAAGTGFFGTGALGEDIEASNKEGVVAAVAAAGGLGGGFDFNSGNGIVEAEGAIFGAGAAGAKNEIGVGFVAAAVGNSADVVAIDVNARSTGGAAGTGVAAGNARLQLTGGTPTSVLAEGSAVGAGGSGATAGASADLLMAESGESTSASGENLRLTVIEGDGTNGAISGTYDSSGPDRFASVSGDVTAGSAMIWGDFSTDTSSSASASAENVGAAGTKIYLGSYADDGTAYSEVYTTLGAGGLNFGEMEAYAGDSTQAKLKYKVVGNYQIVAEASSSDPPDFDTDSDAGWAMTIKDVSGEAWTDNTGAHADVI